MSDPEVEALLMEADKRARVIRGDEFDEVTDELRGKIAALEKLLADVPETLARLVKETSKP